MDGTKYRGRAHYTNSPCATVQNNKQEASLYDLVHKDLKWTVYIDTTVTLH